MTSFQSWFMQFFNQEKTVYVFIFLIAFLLRLIPEIIVPSYPVGYETITYYAPAMINSEVVSVFPLSIFEHLAFIETQKPLLDTVRAGPLFFIIMWSLSDLTGANSFLLLKIVAPILYGFLGISFFVFVRRVIKFDLKVSLFSVLLLIFQIATLRESWDRHRDILSLFFLFTTLTVLAMKDSKQKWATTIFLSVFTVLSRDYVGFLLLITVVGYTLYLKEDKIKNLLLFAPAIVFLLAIFNEVYLEWNYFSNSSPFLLSNYWWAVQDSLIIFLTCYLIVFPLVLFGIRKNHFLTPMVICILLGSFSFIIFPWLAIPGYQRWLMLLVFPFSIYASWGIFRLNLGKHKKKILLGTLMTFMILGSAYSLGQISYVVMAPNSYVPINMVKTSIEWNHIKDVQNSITWFQENIHSSSILLTEERFYGWVLLSLKDQDENVSLIAYGANAPLSPVLNDVLISTSKQVYLMWYTDFPPLDFQYIYSHGAITVYRYDNRT